VDSDSPEANRPDSGAVLPELLAERYRLGKKLGLGGMATVYLARDLKRDATSPSK
jgi:serine/threonine protein kinase